jgi:phosphatidate cytidylyltransferase
MAAWRERFHDIAPRTASGLVLATLGLGAALAGGRWLAAATAAAVVAMCFEWARMSEPARPRTALAVLVVAAVGALVFVAGGAPGWAFAWLAAFAALAALRPSTIAGRAAAAFGVIYIGVPTTAFLWLRAEGDVGLPLMLLLFAVIWLADIFAYLGGVVIGGPRLHPRLSAQKTWSGIASGTFAGALAAAVFATVIGSPSLLFAALGAGTAAVGLAGDLFESLLKRRFGVKDASGLIPGHGGVLDRIDGLMAATCLWALALAVAPGAVASLFVAAR